MNTQDMNITRIYVIEGKEYYQHQMTEELVKKVENPDRNKHSGFMLQTRKILEGKEGTVKLHPHNLFIVYNSKGEEILRA